MGIFLGTMCTIYEEERHKGVDTSICHQGLANRGTIHLGVQTRGGRLLAFVRDPPPPRRSGPKASRGGGGGLEARGGDYQRS